MQANKTVSPKRNAQKSNHLSNMLSNPVNIQEGFHFEDAFKAILNAASHTIIVIDY